MSWTEPKVGDLVTCESTAAIILHARRVTSATPVMLGGHASPRPATLCGTEAAWDTMRPVSAETVHEFTVDVEFEPTFSARKRT